MNKLKFYLGTKLIQACPMTNLEYSKFKCQNELPDEVKEGYLVQYSDDYLSWSPKNVFEEAYKQVDNLNFGLALEALKKGSKVSRKGWNGKGMYLWLKPEVTVKSEWCKDLMLKDIADANNGEILALGTICMFTHDSSGRKAILTGWNASQSDMLSNDWMLI